ncbi:MAG: type II CAAX endopeptidase family protein [Chlamydiota bacterium]
MSPELGSALATGALSALILWIAWQRGFFFYCKENITAAVPIRFLNVAVVFIIYFLVNFFSSSFFVYFLKTQIHANYVAFAAWFNFGASFLVFCSLALYWMTLSENLRIGILGKKNEIGNDVRFALFAWMISFPLVLFLSQLLELLVYHLFNVTKLPDQLAVHFLKSTFEHPLYLLLATASIIVLAPLIEETLFRGFLQTFIRQHLGRGQAIFITSVCFAFFHYSGDQGLGNIPIIGSLFVLSLFLGFLYERQNSLFAPIALHASFNAISVLNLYFLGGFTGGI